MNRSSASTLRTASGTAVVVVLSAAVHALAFPPYGYASLAFVAVAPFLVVIRRLRPRAAALVGYLWGSAAIWGVGYWVADALTFYYQQPRWFGIVFCLVGCQILWGFYYAFFAACVAGLVPRLPAPVRPLLVSVFWVTCELGRARLLTGEPWMLLGYALVPYTRMIQVADLGGVYPLSFLAILVNASIAEILLADGNRLRLALRVLVTPALVLVAAASYGAYRVTLPPPSEPALGVTVVQGNNDLGTQWRQEFYGQGLDRYLRMSFAAAQQTHPQLLVWPESAITFFLAHEPAYRDTIARLLQATGADLIVGGPHHEDNGARYFNSAFYVSGGGRITSRYDKVHLLPFAEYFPLRFIELLRRKFERVRYFTPGDAETLLATRAGPAAVVICLEAIFPELVRERMRAGATMLINLSNDVWLGRGVGQQQHLAMVVLRAVENRTWVIRATTTGISAIIDPLGRIQRQSGIFEQAVLDGVVTPMRMDTVYKRVGDVFAYGCVAASLFAVALITRRAISGGR